MRNSSAFGPDDRARGCANTGETAMERRKFVIGAGALATGSAAAVGSGAFTAAELDARDADISVVDDTDGLIGLEAGDSELVSDDGGAGNQLEIDFNPDDAGGSGVNPNSTYQVGGLGGIDNLDEVPGAPATTPTAMEAAIDTESPIEDYFAFKLTNQSGSAHNIEVTYEGPEDFPEDTYVYMISYWDGGDGSSEQTSALSAVATPDERKASILYSGSEDVDWSDSIPSGHDFKVSLIVQVNGVETDTDLGGDIVVRAGSHDEFTETE